MCVLCVFAGKMNIMWAVVVAASVLAVAASVHAASVGSVLTLAGTNPSSRKLERSDSDSDDSSQSQSESNSDSASSEDSSSIDSVGQTVAEAEGTGSRASVNTGNGVTGGQSAVDGRLARAGNPPAENQDSSTVAPPTAPTSTPICFPGQTCETIDLLDVTSIDGQQVSETYLRALTLVDPTLVGESIQVLIDEANGNPAGRVCGAEFNEASSTELNVRLSVGSAQVQFLFPGEQGVSDRTLNNAEVRYTLQSLGSFGDLQLRFQYDSTGSVQEVSQFIRPPGESAFYQFPVLQQVR